MPPLDIASTGGHTFDMSVTNKEFRAFLKRPKSLDEIAREYGVSTRTAIRRINEVGKVWRVSPAGRRMCLYVWNPPWAKKARQDTPAELAS